MQITGQASGRIWALSDLHLSLNGSKPMDVFGDHWTEHHQLMAVNWDALVADEDIVLTPGDFSWAQKVADVAADFAWLAQRPGTKILVKGNHDHWWPKTKSKMREILPPNCYALKKNACIVNNVGFFGVRGGDFAPLKRYGDTRSQEEVDAILDREERELLLSYEDLRQQIAVHGSQLERIMCLFHYPPIGRGRTNSRFSPIIEASGATHCIYGHLHGSENGNVRIEGEYNGVLYHCTSCDLLDFRPEQIVEAGVR